MSTRSWLSGPSRKAAVIRHLPGTLVALDRDATILWVSESTETLFGFRDDELVGRNAFDLIDPLDAGTAAGAFLRTIETPGLRDPWPLRVVDATGEVRWVEMAPSNLLDDPGIGAVLVGIRPLDELDAARHEARSIEELFRRAFDDAPIGIALVRPDGQFARVNQALCDLLGRPMVEVVGATAALLTHPDDVQLEQPLIDGLLAGTERSYRLEKRFLLPDGSPVWAVVEGSLVRSADGAPERFVVHVRDRSSAGPAPTRFDDRLAIALARTRRVPTTVGVLCCPAGTTVDAVDAALRPGDVVSVAADGQLLALCEDVAVEDDVRALAGRVRRATGAPVGWALWSGIEEGEALVARARAALAAQGVEPW